jgi:hypothetical protein
MNIGTIHHRRRTVDASTLSSQSQPLTGTPLDRSILQNHRSMIAGILQFDTDFRDVFTKHLRRVLGITPVSHKIRFSEIQPL